MRNIIDINTEILPNLNDYIVNTLLNFLLVIISIGISFLVFKTFEKFYYTRTVIKKIPFLKYILHFLFGVIFSCISLLYLKYDEWMLSSFIILFLATSFYYNIGFSLGLVPILLVNLLSMFNKGEDYMNTYNSYRIILNSIIYSFVLINSVAMIFIKKKTNTIFFISNIIIIGIISSIIFPIINFGNLGKLSKYHEFEISMQIAIITLISFSGYSLITLLNTFINKTEKLSEDILYKDGYILEKFAHDQIYEYIKNKKINNAYIIKLAIHGLESSVTRMGSSYATNIKSTVFKLVKEEFNEHEALFYMQSDNSEYFIMLPISDISEINIKKSLIGNELRIRGVKDSLKFIEKIFNKLTIHCQKNLEISGIEIFGYLTIYGISSNDINSINNQLLNLNPNYNYNVQNNIMFYNTNLMFVEEQKNKGKSLEELNEFGPKDIKVNIAKLSNPNSIKISLYQSYASYFEKFLFSKEEIYELADNRATKSAIICHISAKSIKEFVEQKLNTINNLLIIQYPQFLLESKNFTPAQLISNLGSYEVSQKNVVLEIVIDKHDSIELINDNLLELVNNGFTLSFSNITKKDYKMLSKFTPYYCSFVN
ncbi:MAG: hypothetical protein ACRC4L_04035 [Mycoplasma sp.]